MLVIKDLNTGLYFCCNGTWHGDTNHEKVQKYNSYDVALKAKQGISANYQTVIVPANR